MSEQSGDVIARFARLLSSLGPDQSGLSRFCEAGQLLLDADGAAITRTYGPTGREVWSVTDELAGIIADAQEVSGEGPDRDAVRFGEVVQGRIGLGKSERWPFLEDRLVRAGFTGALIAVPLLSDHVRVGVLTAYRWRRHFDLDPEAVDFLGRTVGTALVDESLASDEPEMGEDWPARSAVHQATGMVVAQLSVSPIESWALLRARAYTLGVPLNDVAVSVIQRDVRFDNLSIKGD